MNVEQPKALSQEELDKIAEEQMTSAEKELTKDREKMADDLASAGQTGYIEIYDGPAGGRIEGKINGSELELFGMGSDRSTLDGVELPADVAKRLFEQYKDIAVDGSKVLKVASMGKKKQEALDKAESLFMNRI